MSRPSSQLYQLLCPSCESEIWFEPADQYYCMFCGAECKEILAKQELEAEEDEDSL
jgi:hypothetical protein